MKVHLRYTHRKELAKQLPLTGKGFNMDYRIGFVINIMKRMKPQEFYDHKTAEFVPLDKPEIQKVKSDPKNEQNIYNYM
jgi:hypothetical protein